jgi:hypothetical protein
MSGTIRLTEQLRAITLPDGTHAAVLDVVPPEDAPHAVREGFARRALVNGGDVCPCGARLVWPNPDARRHSRITPVAIEHENDCPAVDTNLARAMDTWLTA